MKHPKYDAVFALLVSGMNHAYDMCKQQQSFDAITWIHSRVDQTLNDAPVARRIPLTGVCMASVEDRARETFLLKFDDTTEVRGLSFAGVLRQFTDNFDHGNIAEQLLALLASPYEPDIPPTRAFTVVELREAFDKLMPRIGMHSAVALYRPEEKANMLREALGLAQP